VTNLVVLAVALVSVSLVREWISSKPISVPMLFVGAGVLVGPDVLSIVDLKLGDESVVLVAEATLATLLFADAARIDTKTLKHSLSLPARLLGFGLPLTVALGTVVTSLLLTDLSWAEAALVAAILTPTDAALGEAVVSDSRVPVRIRQALNVESGLNDGLVVPAVMLFLALSAGEEVDDPGTFLTEALIEIFLGVAIGVGAGYVLARAMRYCQQNHLTDAEGLRLVALGGVAVAYGLATTTGGNGFIAAFVAGLALRLAFGDDASKHTELAEDLGQVGASVTFMLFGAMMVGPALGAATIPIVVCAVGTLTVGRMLPVRIAMVGSGLKPPTTAFIGWFGPRGLASMVFGLLVVVERGQGADGLFSIISLVILASVVLHGITASPGVSLYSRWFAANGHPEMSESMAVPEMPVRWRR